jgi:hypothetical protein
LAQPLHVICADTGVGNAHAAPAITITQIVRLNISPSEEHERDDRRGVTLLIYGRERVVTWFQCNTFKTGLKVELMEVLRSTGLYSQRNATIGSARMARRAGTQHASRAAAPSTGTTAANVSGSVGLVS